MINITDLITSTSVDISRIKQIDKETKPDRYDDNIAELVALYEDGEQARRVTSSYLTRLGLGLRSNHEPVQNGVLDYVVERLSGRYDHPPVRSLMRDDRQVSENSPAHKQMVKAYSRLGLDGVMAAVDRYSTLCGSAYLRVYPSRQRLTFRLFTPDNVMRVVNPDLADQLWEDHIVALRMSYGWEIHAQTLGVRQMVRVDDQGRRLGDELFPGDMYPGEYRDTLPLIRLDTAQLLGMPYLTPRLSRSAYVKVLSGLQADLQAMTAHQAHSMVVYLTHDPSRDPPTAQGPGTVIKMHRDDELRYETPSPLIEQVGNVLADITRSFLFGERIPASEHAGGTPATGTALRVLERPLRARRETGKALAQQAELDLYRIIALLSNAHYGTQMDPDLELELTLNNAEQPADDATILADGAAAMALGIKGPVQVAQQLYGCTRESAVRLIEQAREDLETYPPPAAEEARQVADAAEEDEMADQVAQAAGEQSGDSITDAATGRTASDARDERR